MTEERSFGETVTQLTQVIGLIGALALALALAQLLGLFFQIDIQLLSFLSLQDILVNALGNVPTTIFFLGAGFYFRAINPPSESFLKRFYSKTRISPRLEVTLYLLVCATVYVFAENWASYVLYLTLFHSFVFMEWINRRSDGRLIYHAGAIALLLAIIWFLYGSSRGLNILASHTGPYEIILENDKTRGNIVVTGDKVLILRTHESTIRVIPQSQVREIRRLNIRAREPLWPWLKSLFAQN